MCSFVMKISLAFCIILSSSTTSGLMHQSRNEMSYSTASRRIMSGSNAAKKSHASIRQNLSLRNVAGTSEAYSVDQILDLVSVTDKGAGASMELQEKVSSWMEMKSKEYSESLSSLNKQATEKGKDTSPLTVLDDEKLYGNYDVTFVSTLKASKQQGNPAGGNFRGSLGRFIYENEGLYQHILKEEDVNSDDSFGEEGGVKIIEEDAVANLMESIENVPENVPVTPNVLETILGDNLIPKESIISDKEPSSEEVKSLVEEPIKTEKQSRVYAINYITGKLFRFLTVSVILKGAVQKITEAERTQMTSKYGTALSPGTVRADFESPLITVGGIGIRIGPNSNVVLDTPYLDDKIRLGMGARGSAFIFKRTKDSRANNWKIDIKRKPINAKFLGFLFISFGSIILNLFTSNTVQIFSVLKKIVAFPVIFVGLLLFFTKGGIREENKTLPDRQ
jgi:hypothetical protein